MQGWELIKGIQENEFKEGCRFKDNFGCNVVIKKVANFNSIVWEETGVDVTVTSLIRRTYKKI